MPSSFRRTAITFGWQRQPIEKHGLVLREKLKIVFQHDQIVFADLRVGRVGIFDVDRTIPKGCVAETVIDARNILGWELILLRERLPAVPTIEKFVGQSELELRMVSQIADLMNLQSLRRRSLHDQRVGIVKTKLARHADSKFLELSSHVGRGSGR